MQLIKLIMHNKRLKLVYGMDNYGQPPRAIEGKLAGSNVGEESQHASEADSSSLRWSSNIVFNLALSLALYTNYNYYYSILFYIHYIESKTPSYIRGE